MRSLAGIVVLGTLCAGLAADGRSVPPPARARLRTPSPDGRRVAEVRPRARGGEALWVSQRLSWPDARHGAAQVVSAVVWSERSDALAFAARDQRGVVSLVVVLVDGEAAPAALAWPVPASALPLAAITWLGADRVGAGPAPLAPTVVASWRTSE